MTKHSLGAAALLLALTAALPAYAATSAVTISDYTFTPTVVTIHPGDTVTWANQDSVPHTATALDGKTFDSGAIDPGSSWSFKFTQPGVYHYRCAIHPDMRGEVDVQ